MNTKATSEKTSKRDIGDAAKAQKIAEEAHEGQTDRAGHPYIQHPAHVAASLSGDKEKAVAWLHDVVEDTNVTLDDLRAAGLSDDVVDAIDAMTHREHEDYLGAYIPRIAQNSLARTVKLADLAHNMDLSRLPQVTEADRQRVQKYQRAQAILRDAAHE